MKVEETDFNKNAAVVICYIENGGSLPARVYKRNAQHQLKKFQISAERQHWQASTRDKAAILREWLASIHSVG